MNKILSYDERVQEAKENIRRLARNVKSKDVLLYRLRQTEQRLLFSNDLTASVYAKAIQRIERKLHDAE